MLKLINKLYRLDEVTIDIINALQVKLSSVESKINDLYKQIFLDYADWYLEIKEDEMAISVRSASLSVRRLYVKTRLLGVGTATKEMLESTANSIDGVTVEVSFSDMTVTVTFTAVPDNKTLQAAVNALAEMIPYHLDLIETHQHINWGETASVTWGDVANYTWGSVANSVKGTVSGGLSDEYY